MKPTDIYFKALALAKEYTSQKIPAGHDVVLVHVEVFTTNVEAKFVYRVIDNNYHTGTITFNNDFQIEDGYLSSK